MSNYLFWKLKKEEMIGNHTSGQLKNHKTFVLHDFYNNFIFFLSSQIEKRNCQYNIRTITVAHFIDKISNSKYTIVCYRGINQLRTVNLSIDVGFNLRVLLKVTLLHGCFSRFQIVQMVPNRAKRLTFTFH